MMPEMRGTDLVREVAEKYPQIACVLMTGGTVDSADVPPLSLFRKPLSKQDLIALVEEAIARSAELKAKLRPANAMPNCGASLKSRAKRVNTPHPGVSVPLLVAEPPVKQNRRCCVGNLRTPSLWHARFRRAGSEDAN